MPLTAVMLKTHLFPQVKEASRQQPQMVFTVHHATVTFQTDSETWREQKEKRAALMVGILIGVFVLCWIPFFLTELITPLCSCHIPPIWKSVFLWLGYSNSFFNPLIYTAFNKNYNNAFRNLFSRQRWETSGISCHKYQFKPPLRFGKVWLSELFKKHRFS